MDVPQSGTKGSGGPLQRLSLPLSSHCAKAHIPSGIVQATYLPSTGGNRYLAQALQSTGRVGICLETQRADLKYLSRGCLPVWLALFLQPRGEILPWYLN